jgi:hypothetical protein
MRHSFLFAASLLLIAATNEARAAEEPKASEPKTTGKPLVLFNGKNLDGWDYHLDDKSVPVDKVWSVKDGILRCTGKPAGYIFTKQHDFQNYVLDVEWRWPGKGGNNGVLVHVSKPEVLGVWPKSLEVQLASGEAGDFWIIGTKITVENEQARRTDRRYKNLTDGSEKKLGEWNAIRIICRGDEVIVYVNGDLVNHATNCSEHAGAIALQSEGTPIEFRKVELRKLANE